MSVIAHRCRCGHFEMMHTRTKHGARCVCDCLAIARSTMLPDVCDTMTADRVRTPVVPPGGAVGFGPGAVSADGAEPACDCADCNAVYSDLMAGVCAP